MSDERPKRRAIPVKIKREVCERQGFVCACGCNAPVHWRPRSESVFDHIPALRLRDVLPDNSDYSPGQHDSKYLQALSKPCSDLKTFKKHGADFSDLTKIARERRREKKRTQTRVKKKWRKVKTVWPSRPFPKRVKP